MKNETEIKTYDFDVIEIFKNGWRVGANVRKTFFIAFLIYMVASFVVQTILGIVFPSSRENPNFINDMIVSVISIPLLTPMLVGLMMMALRHVRGETVGVNDLFAYYAKTGVLSLTALVMYIMISIGFILLVLPGIYLSIGYIFALQLVADKDMAIWDAMELSRKTVTRHWFKVFFVTVLATLGFVAGILTLGIGLYWLAPTIFITMYGLLYVMMFEEETQRSQNDRVSRSLR
jgi:uncharacterized membrane protein